MSLTTDSEWMARSLAEAERQRGRRVTVRRLDDVETHPRDVEKPARPPRRERGNEAGDKGSVRPRGTDKPSVPGPGKAMEGAETVPRPEPISPAERLAGLKPISDPEPAPASEPAPAPEPAQALEPAQEVEPTQVAEPSESPELGPALEQPEPIAAPERASEAAPRELTREPGPARAPTPIRRRRLLLYALAAVSIVIAAAAADHWSVLPTVGADTSSSPAQVGGPPHRGQLLPPLDQPPVMHFSYAVGATSPPAAPAGAQNPAARLTGSPTHAKSLRSATG
jgi:hypothetical protein